MPESENTTNSQKRFGDLYIAAASESNARAASLLPTNGSEDVSSILGRINPSQGSPRTTNQTDYLPTTASEWVLNVSLTESPAISVTAVSSLFDKNWRKEFGAVTIYGKDTHSGRWTFLVSADAPKTVTELQFAWSYYAAWDEPPHVTTSTEYERRLKAVATGMGKLSKTKVVADVSPTEAASRSRQLAELHSKYDQKVALILKAPARSKFAGKKVWDVMLCLGLRWGDMDCFHWQNDSGYGDDFHFSVWTTTPPGYFLPEQIATDRLAVDDLVFGFSLPRSADPATVYERMFSATEYAQKRLGGTITTESGRAPDRDSVLKEIREATEALKAIGFSPGSDDALRFF